MPNRCGNKRGLTLVEVMIALSIFLLVLMGLFQTALLSIDSNMKNILRDEAVKIAAMQMEQDEALPFANLQSVTGAISASDDCPAAITSGQVVERSFRNITRKFCVSQTCLDLDGDGDCGTDDTASNTKQLNITVGWRWKGEDFTHKVTTLRRR